MKTEQISNWEGKNFNFHEEKQEIFNKWIKDNAYYLDTDEHESLPSIKVYELIESLNNLDKEFVKHLKEYFCITQLADFREPPRKCPNCCFIDKLAGEN